jgi:hypothetical protein
MENSISPRTLGKGVKIYQFKITLHGTDPEIWRRVEIPGDFTISQFGRAVLKSIGWIPNHWYFFTGPDGETIEDPSQDKLALGKKEKSKEKDATTIKVSELYSMEKKMSEMDVGSDSWLHLIELEAIKDPEARKRYPKCTDGANACPPEDCGGYPGYSELLEAIGNKKHPEHQEMKEWLAGQGFPRFNPKKFKPSDVQFYDN